MTSDHVMTTADIAFRSVSGVVALLGIACNVLVICIIVANRHLRTFTNLLLVNLAASDAYDVVLGVALNIADISDQSKHVDWMCRTYVYQHDVVNYVGIYSMVAIAGFRYYSLVQFTEEQRITFSCRAVRNALVVSIGLWSIAAALNSPVIIATQKIATLSVIRYPRCVMAGEYIWMIHMVIRFVLSYVLPLSVIVYFITKADLHVSANDDHKQYQTMEVAKRKSFSAIFIATSDATEASIYKS